MYEVSNCMMSHSDTENGITTGEAFKILTSEHLKQMNITLGARKLLVKLSDSYLPQTPQQVSDTHTDLDSITINLNKIGLFH